MRYDYTQASIAFEQAEPEWGYPEIDPETNAEPPCGDPECDICNHEEK